MNFEECVEFIKSKHNGQKRKHGTDYYLHPLRVSEMLKEKGFNEYYQITGLFHDLLEDTDCTYEDIIDISNKDIADAVVLVTKEDGYDMDDYINRIKNNDIAHMVKLADRIHNLSEANLADKKFQDKYLKETEKYYLDLAHGTVFESDMNKVYKDLKEFYEKN